MSSVAKAHLKIEIAKEIKTGCEDAKKAADDDCLKWDGGKDALSGAAKKIELLLGHVANDVREDKFDQATAEACQRYIGRAAEICRNLMLKAEVHKQRAQGRAEGFAMTARTMASMQQSEARKAAAGLAPPEDPSAPAGGLDREIGGNRPRNRLEELRSRRMTPGGEVVEGSSNDNGAGEIAKSQNTPKEKPKAKRPPRKKKTKKTAKKTTRKKKT